MASLKPREIDPFLNRPDFKYSVIMLYGPDSGLVSERADALAEKSGVDLSDPFNLIRLSADEAASDPLKLADEANTIAMFGGKRLIRISGKTQRDLMKCLKPLLDAPPEDALILIEAGDLAKSVGLRKNLEKHHMSLCIPCYQDNAAALEKLIDEEITTHGIKLDREARTELRSLLGENRLLTRNELKKLALYVGDNNEIGVQQIREIVGDGSSLVLNELIDAIATGNTTQLQELLPKTVEAGNSPDIILLSCLRHFQMIQRFRNDVERNRTRASTLVDSARPPIHFSRKDLVTKALSLWPLRNLSRALERLDRSMLECRQNSDGAFPIASTALLALALEARALERR